MSIGWRYNLDCKEDLVEIYMEYVLNLIHDSIVEMTVLREYLGGFHDHSQEAHDKRVKEMHSVKDRLYEVFLVTGNEQVIDFIFGALEEESFEGTLQYFNLLLDTLRIVFKDLGNEGSERNRKGRKSIIRNWNKMGHDIGMKARVFFYTETVNLMQQAI